MSNQRTKSIRRVRMQYNLLPDKAIEKIDADEVLDCLGYAVVVLRRTGRIQHCNQAFSELVERQRPDILGADFSIFLAAPEVKTFSAFFKAAVKGRSSARFHFDLSEDRFIPAKITAVPGRGRNTGNVIFSIIDLREFLLREQQIREEEARLQMLASRTRDIMYSLNSEGIVEYVGPQVKRYGYKAEEVIGKMFSHFIVAEDRHVMKEALRKALETGGALSAEFRMQDKSGGIHWLGNRGTVQAQLRNDQNFHIVGILRDITAYKLAARERLEKQQKLRLLASQLTLAEAKERRNLALLLHDTIGLNLALCKIKIGELRSLVQSPELVRVLEAIRNLIGHSLESIRTTTNELSPPLLYEVGLEAALEMLAEQLDATSKVKLKFKDDGCSKPLTDEFRVVLYQAARELVMNALQHAEADTIEVKVTCNRNQIAILVRDDGKGFDVDAVQIPDMREEHFGLFNIHERLDYLGGQLDIKSKIGVGTVARLTAPLCVENSS